jgi:hypothetical protein
MADITAEIDLDSVIDRLLEGELALPKKENMFLSWLFEICFFFLSFFLHPSSFFLYFFFVIGTMGVLAPFVLHLMMRETTLSWGSFDAIATQLLSQGRPMESLKPSH